MGNDLTQSSNKERKSRKIGFLLLALVVITFFGFSFWQIRIHLMLEGKPIGCGGHYGLPCPRGSYCGSPYGKDLGPRMGGNCRVWSWLPIDLIKANPINLIPYKYKKEVGEKIEEKQESRPETSTESPRFTWALIFQNSGFPPNDNFIEGFWAYDVLTKYYHYPKSRIRFITTLNEYSDRWLELGGIATFNSYNEQKILSTKDDIFAQPTKQNYIEGLKWLEEKSTKLDDVIFFSFTHGANSPKGVNFDTDEEFDNDDELFVLGDRNTGKTENFYDGEFADLVAKIRAKNMFIWISACHGGGFAWDIIDRVQKSGNVGNLYLMTQAIDERDVVYVKVPSTNSPVVKFDWPDFKENFFGFLISGLTGLREASNENGDLVLKVNPPEDRSIDFALQEIKDCQIDILNLPATIGILEFTEGSKFPMQPAFGCKWSETSKTREYPNGEATLGYMNRTVMDFIFKTSPH